MNNPTFQDGRPNRYQFTSDGLMVTYEITEDGSPVVTYDDGQNSQTFVDKDVRRQDTEIGTLISVSLVKTVDAGVTIFTFAVPEINFGGQTEQTFETFAVTTQSFGILPHVGARLAYQTQTLQATAQFVPIEQ